MTQRKKGEMPIDPATWKRWLLVTFKPIELRHRVSRWGAIFAYRVANKRKPT